MSLVMVSGVNRSMASLLRPPTFDDPIVTERARILHVSLWATMVVVLSATLIGLDQVQPETLPMIAGYVVICLVGLGVMRTGRVRTVGLIFCLLLWSMVAAGHVYLAHGPVLLTASFINIAIIAGFAVGAWAAGGFGIATVAWMGTTVWSQSTGLMPTPLVEERPIDAVIQSVFPLSMTALLVAYGLRRLRRALEAAGREQREKEALALEGRLLGDLGQQVVVTTDVAEFSREAAKTVKQALGASAVGMYRAVGRSLVLLHAAGARELPGRIRQCSGADRSDVRTGLYDHGELEGLGLAPGGPIARAALVVDGEGDNARIAILAVSDQDAALDDTSLIFLRTCASFLGAAVDRVEKDTRLRQAQKMEAIGQLAGGVAHDFNNLLTTILGCATIAIDEVPNAETRELLVDIKRAGDHAALLTRQLLAFSRKETLRPESLDLQALVESLGGIVGRLLGPKIHFDITPGQGGTTVYADRHALEQILLNLCLNARDAIEDTGSIEVAVEARGETVALVVRDDGVGMDEATQERIFEPFFTTKGSGHGTGLGLATVHGIVEEIGGEIAVRSRRGEGTTFVVALPAAQPGQTAEAAALEEVPGARDGEVVLLVEDHDLARRTLNAILLDAGYEVVMARDGVEGLGALESRTRVDVVVSDVVMPTMGGDDLVRAARNLGWVGPFILLSGYPARGRPTADERSFPDVPLLPKPVASGDLLRTIRNAIDRAQPRRRRPPERPNDTAQAAASL